MNTIMTFKNKTLEKFYYQIMKKYPILMFKRLEIKKVLMDIELPDKNNILDEQFFNDLYINGCGDITVVWNIDKILQCHPTNYEYFTSKDLFDIMNNTHQNMSELFSTLKPRGVYIHKTDIIILAMFPGFPQYTIIDGNHRVLEYFDYPAHKFKCLILNGTCILDYLEPNSRKLAEFLFKLENILSHIK